MVFVKLRSGVSRTAGLASLQRIANTVNRAFAAVPDGGGGGYNVAVLGVQRPAEIVNYRTMGALPRSSSPLGSPPVRSPPSPSRWRHRSGAGDVISPC
jgi:hypothetical protein